mmetsp:Transcript_82918/g.234562  ORF Transcript_82918/g.234562 Transcript_82918/m.234562 type:complete len:142 (+) Transcript_82918:169-594(+)
MGSAGCMPLAPPGAHTAHHTGDHRPHHWSSVRGAAYSRSPATELASPVEAVSPPSVEAASPRSWQGALLPWRLGAHCSSAGGVDDARARRSYIGSASMSRKVFLTTTDFQSSSGEQADEGDMASAVEYGVADEREFAVGKT